MIVLNKGFIFIHFSSELHFFFRQIKHKYRILHSEELMKVPHIHESTRLKVSPNQTTLKPNLMRNVQFIHVFIAAANARSHVNVQLEAHFR